MQPLTHIPSSTPRSSPRAPHIYLPCSPQDTLTWHLATRPQFGSRLASCITQACCIHAVGHGFPPGHTAEHRCRSEGLAQAVGQHTGLGPAMSSSGGGMAAPPGMVTQAERLPLYHMYYTYCHNPAAPGSIRQPTVASSTAEEHDAIWYLCNFYTIDTKGALAPLTIEGAPGSTHLQSTGCLKASLATQIKSTIRLETH